MSKTIGDFSRAFYPFLHEDETKPQELMEELRFSLMEKARESVEVKARFFEDNIATCNWVQPKSVPPAVAGGSSTLKEPARYRRRY